MAKMGRPRKHPIKRERTPATVIAAWRAAYQSVHKKEPDNLIHEDGEFFFEGRNYRATQGEVRLWTKRIWQMA